MIGMLQHNLSAMNANRQLNISTGKKAKASEKLSSGYRINRAADDAAGLSISEKMRWQIRGLSRGAQNTQEGVSWIQVGDGAMDEITKIIQRIRELAVQGSNDTNTDSDRSAIDQEIKELRKEINKISLDTEFNTKDIFDNSYVSMDVIGSPNDLQIFDASYDDKTGDVSWGGFVFHGERITWDTVSPGMVDIDPTTGKQVFTGGNYAYTDPTTGYKFNINCEPGAEVPDISRTIEISADSSGVTIDGQTIDWSKLYDENDTPLSASNVHGGAWSLEYEGAKLGFFIGDVETIDDVADAINSCNNGVVSYTWKSEYKGQKPEKAVDASLVKNLQISNGLAQNLSSAEDIKYIVKADNHFHKTGIWLENATGSTISGSYKSWKSMGISSWKSGSDINSTYTYTYSDNEGVNDTYISFDFKLSDITSADSVIDGLDGMEISGKNITTNYATYLNAPLDGNLVKAIATSKNPITFAEEKQLGRDFDTAKIQDVADADVQYDAGNSEATLEFGSGVITYKGQTGQMEKELQSDVNTYIQYALKRKQAAVLSGLDPDQLDIGTGSLTDLVGTSNITTSGYFSETVTIDGSMKLTDGSDSGVFKPGEIGKTYPTASIDFKGLGTAYSLDDLLGLGFNSTCQTCSKHYSVAFTSGASGSTSASGYNYNFKEQGANYTLQIDIESLKNEGITNGKQLADALVEISSECFDLHYTQYAAQGSKLYVYDDRVEQYDIRHATFDTQPFNAIDSDEFKLALKHDDGREIDITYVYDYGDVADGIKVNMVQDNSGAYVLNSDGKTYSAYDPKLHAGIDPGKRFQMDIKYQNKDSSIAANISDYAGKYVENALQKMLGNSNIQLDAQDYTYVGIEGDENPNVAIRAIFDSKMEESPYENGIHIQNSSNVGDDILIPRFALNSVVLHLFTAGTKDFEQAQSTIDNADYALDFISNKRSLYGAYQNRLEHTYNNSTNTAENTQAAESRLRDVDMADMMVQFSAFDILQQAGESMLAQANQSKQNILQLFQQS